MERPRFEAPSTLRWPLWLALGLAIGALAGGFWLWRTTPQGSAAGEELLATITTSAPVQRPSQQPQATPAPPEASAEAPRAISSPPQPGLTGTPIDDVPLDELLETGDEAFDMGDWRVALETYKLAAVRMQVKMQTTLDDAERQELADELAAVLERVRVAQTQAGIESGRQIDLANRTPHAPPTPGEVRELGIMDLGNFVYDDEEGGLPEDVQALDGLQVRVSGYMVPAFQTDQIRQFTLVADIFECCFGQPPGVEHTINVILPDGRAMMFTYGEILVTGTLRVEEERRGGFTVNVFTIEDVTSVRLTGR